MTAVTARDWMIPYLISGSTGNPEPPKNYDKTQFKFVIAKLPGQTQKSGFLIPRNMNSQYVKDFKADKVVQDAAKLYKPVTIYGDDSPEIQAAKMAVAQKRQAAITLGGFVAQKAIIEDKPMEITQQIQEAYSDVKGGVNVGNALKALGIGAGGALIGASAYMLLNQMNKNGGGNMGLGTTYAQVDDFLGGYLPGGISPTANVQLDAQAGIVKRYPNGMYRFADGKMGIIGKNGLLKTWRPYKCIVIGKRPTIGQLSRVVKRAKVWQKGLNKLLR